MIAPDVQVRFPSERHSAAEASTALARSALEHWRWAVRGVPFTASSSEACTALRGLTAWYERICVDDLYDHPAPADGLDALTALERGSDLDLSRRVVVTHWAVRVAQELAGCRRGLRHDGDLAAAFLERSKLDLALQGAFDRLR
jgi:hypothetical protein